MADVVELGRGESPPGDGPWVLVHITHSKDVASTGNVIIHSMGVTFQSPASEPQISLNIEHAKDEADERGLSSVYVQRDVPHA